MAEKKSFKLYVDYEEHLKYLSNEELGQLFRAIFAHENQDSEEPEGLSGMVLMAYSFIRAQLDRDRDSYDDQCKTNSLNGKKGGRPKKTEKSDRFSEETEKSDRFFEKPKKADTDTDTDKDTDTDTDTDTETDTDIDNSVNAKRTHARFTPPTVDEVRAYCTERGNSVDPEHFIDHYSSNGWLVGKNKMKDWKAAVRTWEKNGIGSRDGPSKKTKQYHGREYSEDDYSSIEAALIGRGT